MPTLVKSTNKTYTIVETKKNGKFNADQIFHLAELGHRKMGELEQFEKSVDGAYTNGRNPLVWRSSRQVLG